MPASTQPDPDRPTVFVSYSHKDEKWKDRLVQHLKVLEREPGIEVWHDRRIASGADWLPEIEHAMERAVAAVLLISPDSLTSEFILRKEVPELLERRSAKGLLVIPLIVEPCVWQGVSWLASIQCRPKDGRALSLLSRPRANEALVGLVNEIRQRIGTARRPARPTPSPHPSPRPPQTARENAAGRDGNVAAAPNSHARQGAVPGGAAAVAKPHPPITALPVPGQQLVQKVPVGGREIDGPVLVYVPGGEYILGAADLSEGEKPVHKVVLSPFWIGKFEVTNEQYGQFLRAVPGTATPKFWTDERFNQPRQPVVGVSWEEARAYCSWAGLALPSEAQWEAAARGTDHRRYPWGNEVLTPERANYDAAGEGQTTSVGSFPRGAGPFGTLDQAGNVWEWCEDVWDAKAYSVREGTQDPVGTRGDAAIRCLRGGSWYFDARFLAAACRFKLWASYRVMHIGFRCVLPSSNKP